MPNTNEPSRGTETGTPRRILVIHPGALGDFVQAFPAFATLRAAHPTAQLTLVVGDDLAAFATRFDLFDRVEPFDAVAAYRGRAATRLALVVRLATRLRTAAPDAVAVFKGALPYAVLARASGAPQRVGLARGSSRRLLTTPIPIDPGVHREERFLAVARALGPAPDDVAPVAWPAAMLPPEVAEPTAARTAGGVLMPAVIAVAPGGARNAKQDHVPRRWPARKFAEAIRLLHDEQPIRIVLLGGSTDRVEAAEFRAGLGSGIELIDLVGRTSVIEARAVIAACDTYLGNDSGLMHVAGTTRTPIVAVFGPTDPRVAAPRRPGVYTIWRPAHATPCTVEVDGSTIPCAAVCCMDRVTTREVADALQTALGDRRRDAGPRTGDRDPRPVEHGTLARRAS